MTANEPYPSLQRYVAELREVMGQQESQPARRRPRALGLLAVLVPTALSAGAAIAAVSGVFTVEHRDGFDIQTRAPSATEGLCLQLKRPAEQPLYGCGSAPAKDKPFGLLVVGAPRAGVRTVFGVVDDAVARVQLQGATSGGSATTRVVPGVPGRFFSTDIAGLRYVNALAKDSTGGTVGRLGSVPDPQAPAATSRQQAQDDGEIAGFAGGYDAPTQTTLNGRPSDARSASRDGVVCTQTTSDVLKCTTR